MKIGKKIFDVKTKYHIMGILNITPDSFSDGGRYSELSEALDQVEKMIAQGASIIDVGGMSTRPGYTEISIEDEIHRVLPVLKAIKDKFQIPVSLDTYRSEVVEASASYIDMVNDITGLTHDENMAWTVAKYQLSICIMAHKIYNEGSYGIYHDQKADGNQSKDIQSEKYMEYIVQELKNGIKIAIDAGIPNDQIMIDGGVGFGKSHTQNLMTIHHTKELAALGYPVLMATSNKGFMREITGNFQADKVSETITTTIVGAVNGARFFRVHDVELNNRALKTYQAIETMKL